MSYAAHVLLIVVPFVALAILSVILAKRHRTTSTALAALGFSLVVLSHIVTTAIGLSTFSVLGGHPVAALSKIGWIFPLVYWVNFVGLWVGAFGLLWYVLSLPSPNNASSGRDA
jgi:hypothetical protein